MEIIKATSNSRVRHVRTLSKDRAYRYRHGQYVAEGDNIISALDKSEILEIFVTEKRYEEYRGYSDSIAVTDDNVMNSMSAVDTPPGVIAVMKMTKREIVKGEPSIVLDSISDPGNLGAIMRTAAACGIRNFVLFGDTCDPYSPKAVRASMGGIRDARFTRELPDIIYALDMGGEDIYGFRTEASDFGLAVGNEAHGIGSAIRSRAVKILSLPMSDGMESLNAAVSASIAMYQLVYGSKPKI